jgi:release factor glutamine methyltransferase
MNKDELFLSIKTDLTDKLNFLDDKPEETVDSSIKALWLKASGISKSSEEAAKSDLPELSEDQKIILNQLIKQRLNNTPLAYITGRQNFMGIELLCDKRALIPRKETEILGRTALKICESISKTKDKPLVLDLCCGSGNLGLALSALSPKISVFSSDLSKEAVDLAKENNLFLNLVDRVTVLPGDLFEAFESNKFLGQVDIIVCNPPYISSTKVTKMNIEISNNEPVMAFDGGMIGTKIIQQLIREAPRFLVKGGSLIFEVGLGQGTFIGQLCQKSGNYDKVVTVNDEAGNIRVIHCIF